MQKSKEIAFNLKLYFSTMQILQTFESVITHRLTYFLSLTRIRWLQKKL